jgi:hypothetical protein
MVNRIRLSACVILVSSSITWAKKSADSTVKPNCIPVRMVPSQWDVAFCSLPENNHYYPTEMRFSRDGKLLFKYVQLSDPTFGYAEATLLTATERFVVFELEGDETDQVLAFDLKRKALVLNTGAVDGMHNCRLVGFDEKLFCDLQLSCPMGDEGESPNDETAIREFLCR